MYEQTNMAKLKVELWKSLVSSNPSEVVPDENMYQREVPEKKFSQVYEDLSSRINEEMKAHLNSFEVFAALMELASEHNLTLTQVDLTDFIIKQLATRE